MTVSTITEVAVIYGDILSLLCGTNLISKPQTTTVTLYSPNGVIARRGYNYKNFDDIKFNVITNQYRKDIINGSWKCTLNVTERNVYDRYGILHQNFVVGLKNIFITVYLVGKSIITCM